MWQVAADALRLGNSVVLDWNHWSRERRADAKQRAADSGFPVVVHYLDVPVSVAVERAARRQEFGDENSHRIDEAGVRRSATLLEPPTDSEGMTIIRHGA